MTFQVEWPNSRRYRLSIGNHHRMFRDLHWLAGGFTGRSCRFPADGRITVTLLLVVVRDDGS